MGKEEWTVFRNKIAKLDEHFENWLQNLNELQDDQPIVQWLKEETESYKVVYLSNYLLPNS